MRRHQRRILTVREREALQALEREQRIQLEAPTLMAGANGKIFNSPDISGLQEPYRVHHELRRTRHVLDMGGVHDQTRKEIIQRDKEIRELEERIRKRMIPRSRINMPKSDSAEYRAVVNEIVAQARDKRFCEDVESLKNMRRLRSPDDPNAGNIEDLREN